MPRNVEISVHMLARSRMDTQSGEVAKWLRGMGVPVEDVERLTNVDSEPTRDDAAMTDAEGIIGLAGKRCYKSFTAGLNPNVSKIRKDIGEYLENILKAGHGSVLEHVTYTFAIENVSRVFTGEMNRHRAGMAISEGSMRYIRYEDIPYWLPTSIQAQADDTPEITTKKMASREIFNRAFRASEQLYSELTAIWKDELSPESKFKAKKEITSMMRRIIPMGVATGGIWTGNIRALRHICEMRCSAAAEEEILLVATKMLNILRQLEPNLFGDFTTDASGLSAPKYRKV